LEDHIEELEKGASLVLPVPFRFLFSLLFDWNSFTFPIPSQFFSLWSEEVVGSNSERRRWEWNKSLKTSTPFHAPRITCCRKPNLGLLVFIPLFVPNFFFLSVTYLFVTFFLQFNVHFCVVVFVAVSVIGLIIMATLFVHELRYYLTTYTVHQVFFFTHELKLN